MADPFAAAGFAPAVMAPNAGDPFSAAGFAAAAQPPQPATMPTPIGVTEYGAPIYADEKANAEVNDAQGRVGEKILEGTTFGLWPYAAAAVKSLGGTPYQQALQEARDYTKQTSQEHPAISALAEGAGSVPLAAGAFKLAVPIGRAAGNVIRFGRPLVDTLTGAILGAGSSAGHDIGLGETDNLGTDIAKGGAAGGVLAGLSPAVGTVLQMAPNMVRSGVAAVRNIATGAGRDAVAGQILRESGGDFANTAAASPIPGMELRTAQATGNPGLAALERTLASEPGTQASLPGQLVQNGRTPDQMSALARALVGSNAGQEPAILTNEASARGTQAIQGARDVLRQAENDLWNAPELRGVRLRSNPLVSGVQYDVAHMPPSFRMAMDQGDLAGLMQDVAGIRDGASIADVNAIRSRVLEQARDFRAAGHNVQAAAAQGLADSLLNRVEGALGGAGDAIREAYSTARDFTRQRAQAFGFPEFDAILRPNAAGNMRANDETAFGRFFDLNGGTDAGLQRLQTVSGLLRATGQPESVAQANALDNAARDYLRAGVLRQARAGGGLDATGAPAINPATLASTINRQMPAITGAPIVSPIAGDLQASGNAAELLNRPSTLRGDSNSTTYEKLRNRDLVSAIMGQAGSSALGAAAGGYAAAEHGPGTVPLYLRVPGGMLAGALLGRQIGPYVGRTVAHIPGASAAVTGPSEDIMRRLASGLASPAEYQRLLATQLMVGPGLTEPGALSTLVPAASRAVIPAINRGGAP